MLKSATTMEINDKIDILTGFSLEDIKKLKVKELKRILIDNNESVSGQKATLISRVYALVTRKQHDSRACSNSVTDVECVVDVSHLCGASEYTELLDLAGDSCWHTDLRKFPETNFHQIYEYLVVVTKKYGDTVMKGTSYKKERAYAFFKEGHIGNIKIAHNRNLVIVQACTIASMKAKKYKVSVVFDKLGDVKHAVCQCPAGKGPNACGRCNHIGAVLFYVEEFGSKGYKKLTEEVSCTSKLNGWIIPRNLKVTSTPVPKLKIKKNLHGKKNTDNHTATTYDPRAPQHRVIDPHALQSLYNDLESCLPASGFFLFHEEPATESNCDEKFSEDSFVIGEHVEVTTTPLPKSKFKTQSDSELLRMSTRALCLQTEQISDDVPVDAVIFKRTVSEYLKEDKIDENTITLVEQRTKNQSESRLWKDLHNVKLTASNFGKAIKCSRNPDSALKYILYSTFSSDAMHYGCMHEDQARTDYVNKKAQLGEHVEVNKMGILLCKENAGLGASVDGRVLDITTNTYGCLEIKCPPSRAGMSVENAVASQPFCLIRGKDGMIQLNRNHDYYYQVQGQMYITGFEWTDFVVWLGDNNIYIERIMFDRNNWMRKWLPALNNFYKLAFVPELITRRVKRGVILYPKGKWKKCDP